MRAERKFDLYSRGVLFVSGLTNIFIKLARRGRAHAEYRGKYYEDLNAGAADTEHRGAVGSCRLSRARANLGCSMSLSVEGNPMKKCMCGFAGARDKATAMRIGCVVARSRWKLARGVEAAAETGSARGDRVGDDVRRRRSRIALLDMEHK